MADQSPAAIAEKLENDMKIQPQPINTGKFDTAGVIQKIFDDPKMSEALKDLLQETDARLRWQRELSLRADEMIDTIEFSPVVLDNDEIDNALLNRKSKIDMGMYFPSYQANGGNRHLGIQTLDANREIACRPATANVLLKNLDLVFFPWPAIHELVVVGAPGAACNETKPVFPGLHSASGLRTGSVTSRSLSMALAGAMPFDARVS